MFAILDIETTGGSPKTEKITEIAIFFHDGKRIVDEWSTLLNPEKTIPYFITGLTGITNEMVANAPAFYEVAKEIVERTENHTIVGHNVEFDYSFIKSEFKQLGFEFNRKTLCTVQAEPQDLFRDINLTAWERFARIWELRSATGTGLQEMHWPRSSFLNCCSRGRTAMK